MEKKIIKLPIYLMKIDEGDEGVSYVSLVDDPATEQNYLQFNSEINQQHLRFSQNIEKRILTGPLMLANTPILRADNVRGQYYAVFTPEVIEKMVIRFFKQGNIRNVNVEHSFAVEGVYMFESYIINKSRGINPPNEFSGVPDGSWFGSYKIENDEVWNNRHLFHGFSIEGFFGLEATNEVVNLELESQKEEYAKSYSDYGEGVRNNAKRGIELNEKNGNKCATQTGKVRAQQLANGEALSVQTIKRMYSYLSRAETYYDNADSNSECGYISYLLWGGKAALGWSRNKLRELGELNESEAAMSEFTKEFDLFLQTLQNIATYKKEGK